jgi:hypothetical protein
VIVEKEMQARVTQVEQIDAVDVMVGQGFVVRDGFFAAEGVLRVLVGDLREDGGLTRRGGP